MDARTSRYHEVYARSMRDPEGFWGEAAQAIDWYEPAKKVFDKDAGVYGRWFTGAVVQHLLQRDRPPRGARPRATSPRSSTTRRSPAPSASSPMRSCCDEVQTLAAILQDFGVSKGDRVILYMPMVPEALFAMYACARIGAIHSVVFGGFARERARDAHRRLQAEADPLGLLRHRGRARRPVQAAARCRDRSRQGEARGLPDPAAPASRGRRSPPGRDHDWAALRDAGARGEQVRALRAGARDRSALHPLHLGHDRHPEGRGARQWRPHGRARTGR